MGAESATVTPPAPAAPPPAGGAAPAPAAAPATPPASGAAPAVTSPPAASTAPAATPAQESTLLSTGETAPGGTGAKGTEAPKPAAVELKLPEGFKETPALAQFKALAGEAGLKSEVAQKIFDTYVEAEKQRGDAQLADWKQQQTKWADSLKADKEFGGAAFGENLALAKRAIGKFGNPELTNLLNTTWVGNHPGIVKLLRAVGKSMSEDSVSGTSGASGQAPTQQDQLQVLYPTHYAKKE